jgi:hypothetical protein
LNASQFQSDFADENLRARVKSESAFADRVGAPSTPSFMVNGKLKVGWGSWLAFRQDVERELDEARKLEAQGTPVEEIAALRAQAQIDDPERLKAYREIVLWSRPRNQSRRARRRKSASSARPSLSAVVTRRRDTAGDRDTAPRARQ